MQAKGRCNFGLICRARFNAVVPRNLARDHRDDVIADMAIAIQEELLREEDIARRVGGKAGWSITRSTSYGTMGISESSRS